LIDRRLASTLHQHRKGIAGRISLGALTLLVAAAAFLPGIAQDPSYHRFADQRAWLGVPHATDVLSNLAFALAGLAGLVRLASRDRAHFAPAVEAGMRCIALGFVATALGSAWYHAEPTDASLVWDRLAIVVVFAGMLGAAMPPSNGDDRGRSSLASLVALGIASVIWWRVSGNLAPYLAFQFGGMLILVVLVATGRASAPIPWLWVIAWYGLAKAAEVADREIWELTRGIVAGHALKHLLAAVAGATALSPLWKRR
jgi:hypothetical protein